MLTPEIVIFDCDGVLFDSKEANLHYYNTLLARFGHPPMTDSELDFVHMHNVMESIDHIFRHYPEDLEQAHALRRRMDYTPFLRYMRMEPDLPAFLDFLDGRCHTAISTNRTTTMPAVLAMNGLAGRFAMVVTALDVTHPKPHPEALEKILDHFGLAPEQGVFIGDSVIDEEHARRAGVPFIAFRNPRLAADHHVASFTEVMRLPCFQERAGQPSARGKEPGAARQS